MMLNDNPKTLERICEDFSRATNISLIIADANFSIFQFESDFSSPYCRKIHECPSGRQGCLCSDTNLMLQCQNSKQPERHMCHAGLWDMAIPILHQEDILGYLILGQIKTSDVFPSHLPFFKNNSLNLEELKKAYLDLPLADNKKIQSVIALATMLASYILLKNVLIVQENQTLDRAINYIQENLVADLSVNTIASTLFVSRSTLYRLFQNRFHCSVYTYINRKRIEKSLVLLRCTTLSMEDVAHEVGFSSATYFGRLFKKQMGISPLQYRKKA